MLNKLTPPHSYLFFIISKYLLVSKTKKKRLNHINGVHAAATQPNARKRLSKNEMMIVMSVALSTIKKNIDTETEGDLYTEMNREKWK